MNCRFCGAAIPQGMAYCPTCKQPVFQAPGSAQQPSFPPPSTGQLAGSYGANPQMPAASESQAGRGPFVPSLSSPQTPNNTYAPQASITGGPRPHTENLSPMPFAQPGNQFSPIANDQPWPAPFTQPPSQQFSNSFPPAQPKNSWNGAPQTPPFAGPNTPGHGSNAQQFAANASQPFFTNQGPFPAPSLPGQSPSGSFPRPAFPPTTPERSSGPWSSPANFSNNMAQAGNPETSSRFLYGPSASNSFPFNAGGPSTGNLGANASMPSTPGQGFPFANPGNTSEPARTNPSGHLASAIIAPTRKRRAPMGIIGIITLVVVIAIGGVIGAVEYMNGGSDLTSNNNSIFVPVTIPLAGATPVSGPSGQKATTTASSIIINAQTASAISSNYIPTHTTTSFTTNQTIYTSLVINSNKQNGYIMIKWYQNNRLLSSDNLAHNAKDDIAFFTQKYTSPSSGSAELYWCTKADCSDAQLARVVNFTIH